MSKTIRMAGVLVLGLALAARLLAGAADLKTAVLKYAADIKAGKGSPDATIKAAQDDLLEVMYTMKPAKKDGIKLGNFEGIEKKIQALAKGAAEADTKSLEEMGYITQALAHVTEKMPTDKAKRSLNQWKDFSAAMADGGKKLASAAKAGKAKDIETAAAIINNACNGCHSKFR